MQAQRLLYFSTYQITAYFWQRGTLTSEASFPPTDDGWQQLAQYLAEHRQSVFSLLVNVAEEGFQRETIPYLRGADRQTVIQRKLAQTFFNTSLGTAISLGHEKDRRKNEHLLLAALTNPALLKPCLSALRSEDAALSGIFSPPLLAPSLLTKLRLTADPCLLLTFQDQSIRQTFLDKGMLRFSRLSPLQDTSIASLARSFASEAIKMQQYLASQRLIRRDQAITAHVLAHPDAFTPLNGSCIDTPAVRFNIVDITECARRIGLKTAPQDTHAESLFLHLLIANRPRSQFADEELRHNYRVVQTRSLIQGGGALMLIACLLFAGKQLFDAREIIGSAEATRNEAQLARQRYDGILKTFPNVPTDNETLKRVIDSYLAQEKRSTSPLGLYREVSRALQEAPTIDIDRLDWRIGGGTEGTPTGNAATTPLPEDSESIIVRGNLRLFPKASARQLLAVFDGFVDTLRANPALRVDILQQPLDIASGISLRGGDSVLEEEKPRDFTLAVSRKIAP